MADNLKEIFEEAGEFAEANNNKLTLADAVVLIAEAYELGLNTATQLLIIPEVWITTLATVFLIPITNDFTHICNDMINKPSPLHYFKGNGGKCNRLFYFSPKNKN